MIEGESGDFARFMGYHDIEDIMIELSCNLVGLVIFHHIFLELFAQ